MVTVAFLLAALKPGQPLVYRVDALLKVREMVAIQPPHKPREEGEYWRVETAGDVD
jgi:hypothetical protein